MDVSGSLLFDISVDPLSSSVNGTQGPSTSFPSFEISQGNTGGLPPPSLPIGGGVEVGGATGPISVLQLL